MGLPLPAIPQVLELVVARPSPVMGNLQLQTLRSLDGVGRFSQLRTLRVAHHGLCSLAGVEALHHLEDLDVSHNSLRRLSGLEAIAGTLRRLDAGCNYISRLPLEDVAPLAQLRYLCLEDNSIAGRDEVANLAGLPHLHQLRLRGNPVCEDAEGPFLSFMCTALPLLRQLDDSVLAPHSDTPPPASPPSEGEGEGARGFTRSAPTVPPPRAAPTRALDLETLAAPLGLVVCVSLASCSGLRLGWRIAMAVAVSCVPYGRLCQPQRARVCVDVSSLCVTCVVFGIPCPPQAAGVGCLFQERWLVIGRRPAQGGHRGSLPLHTSQAPPPPLSPALL